MRAALDALQKEALRLPESERAKLALELLESLEHAPNSESTIDAVKRRAAELESGKVHPIPADDVFQKARGLLR